MNITYYKTDIETTTGIELNIARFDFETGILRLELQEEKNIWLILNKIYYSYTEITRFMSKHNHDKYTFNMEEYTIGDWMKEILNVADNIVELSQKNSFDNYITEIINGHEKVLKEMISINNQIKG